MLLNSCYNPSNISNTEPRTSDSSISKNEYTIVGKEFSSTQLESIFNENIIKYDTIYVVSTYSCSACIDENLSYKMGESTTVVYDHSSFSTALKALEKQPNINVPQENIENTFGEFGNALTLIRTSNGKYYVDNIK